MTARRRVANGAAPSIALMVGLVLVFLLTCAGWAIFVGNITLTVQPVSGPPGPALTFIGAHDPFPVLDHGHADLAGSRP